MYVHANLRPTGVPHESIFIVTGYTQYKVGAAWFNSSSPSSYAVRAIDGNQNVVLIGMNELNSSYAFDLVERTNLASWFRPVSATEIHGFELEVFTPPEGTDYNVSFDFSSGAQGWQPAPYHAIGGTQLVPRSYTPNWGTYFKADAGKLQTRTRNADHDWEVFPTGPDSGETNCWCYFPPDQVYGVEGATMYISSYYQTTGFNAHGVLYKDGTWQWASWYTNQHTYTVPANANGKEVKCFQFHLSAGTHIWHWIEDCSIVGFTRTPITAYRMFIEKIEVFNICSI